MFSNSKNNAARQNIFQELSEEQLTQVAGGSCSSSSSSDSDMSKSTHKHHHHHHKHHHWHKTTTNKYNSDWKKSSMPKYGSGNSKW